MGTVETSQDAELAAFVKLRHQMKKLAERMLDRAQAADLCGRQHFYAGARSPPTTSSRPMLNPRIFGLPASSSPASAERAQPAMCASSKTRSTPPRSRPPRSRPRSDGGNEALRCSSHSRESRAHRVTLAVSITHRQGTRSPRRHYCELMIG